MNLKLSVGAGKNNRLRMHDVRNRPNNYRFTKSTNEDT